MADSHLTVDFTKDWEAWCHAQDGGCPNAAHDLRRVPTTQRIVLYIVGIWAWVLIPLATLYGYVWVAMWVLS